MTATVTVAPRAVTLRTTAATALLPRLPAALPTTHAAFHTGTRTHTVLDARVVCTHVTPRLAPDAGRGLELLPPAPTLPTRPTRPGRPFGPIAARPPVPNISSDNIAADGDGKPTEPGKRTRRVERVPLAVRLTAEQRRRDERREPEYPQEGEEHERRAKQHFMVHMLRAERSRARRRGRRPRGRRPCGRGLTGRARGAVLAAHDVLADGERADKEQPDDAREKGDVDVTLGAVRGDRTVLCRRRG